VAYFFGPPCNSQLIFLSR